MLEGPRKKRREEEKNTKAAKDAGTLVRREQWERICRIHGLVGQGMYPNSRSMAREFEVSVRTVKRDMGFMRDHFDSPLEFDARRRGFYYSRAGVRLPGMPEPSEEQVTALLLAKKGMGQYTGLPVEACLGEVLGIVAAGRERGGPKWAPRSGEWGSAKRDAG